MNKVTFLVGREFKAEPVFGDFPQVPSPAEHDLDHMIERNGFRYAGSHIIADFYDASDLTSIEKMERAFKLAIDKAGATLLHMHFHHFSPTGGISGVAVLAESHISVHTWPENNFAAFDIFMCGSANPMQALSTLQAEFQPGRVQFQEYLRGRQV